MQDQEFTLERLILSLTDTEILQRREALQMLAIELQKLENERQEFNAAMKLKAKPLQKSFDETLRELETGQAEKLVKVAKVQNFNALTMEFYNEDGVLIYSRPLEFNERQLIIKPLND